MLILTKQKPKFGKGSAETLEKKTSTDKDDLTKPCLNSWSIYHRINTHDRIEKCMKGRRIGHCAFAASIFKVLRLRQYGVVEGCARAVLSSFFIAAILL